MNEERNANEPKEEQSKNPFLEELNELSDVKKVIGVVSGKGGVGKSLVTSLMAVAMRRKGFQTAVMDADITGPSIPRMFGIKSKARGNKYGVNPPVTDLGLKLMSINLMLEEDTDPVVWRGPVVANIVKQFWTDVNWGEIDYMFVDMPPGTGDVPLTVFQSLPIDGIIIVTSPQELVGMIVGKAVKMAQMMNIPVLGVVENMSYFECPDCHATHKIFGESHVEELAKEYGIEATAKIPIDPRIANRCDEGQVESIEGDWLAPIVDNLP